MHVARDVAAPLLLNIAVVVEVELAVDDGERRRLDGGLVAARRSKRAEAAILRRVFGRIGDERITVGGRAEVERRALVVGGERRRALHGLSLREVGDGIV